MAVNKVILVGRLGQKPEERFTQSGTAVTNFSVATNEKWTDKAGQKQEHTEWHRVVAWDKLAKLCVQYLDKGREVYIEGKLATRQYEKDGQKHYATEIVASTVQFLGGAPQGAGAGAPAGAGPAPGGALPPGGAPSFTEDDIPF
jgi:single-strand DNA-binding protein